MGKQIFNYPSCVGIQIPIKMCDINNKQRSVEYYVRQMLNRLQCMFEWKGLPDNISQRDIELMLQTGGHVCITELPDSEQSAGLWCFNGGLGGTPSRYYRPTLYIVANPTLKKSYMLKIIRDENQDYVPEQGADGECVVISNDSTLQGLLPLLERYATQLAENDISMRMVDINARLSSLISADDDSTAESAKRLLKQIEDGELGVIGESGFLDGVKAQPYASSAYTAVMTTLIEYQQYLKAGQWNDLGLQANYNMKRESINTNEAQMNNDALLPLAEDMLNCRKKGAELVNKIYGTNITVDFASSWKVRQDEIMNPETKETETETKETETETKETEVTENDVE